MKTIWVFDTNRRIYPPPKQGQHDAFAPPIWIEHWREVKIVGETSKSWILENKAKVPKKNYDRRHYLFTRREVELAAYANEHRRAVADAVLRDAVAYDVWEIGKRLGVDLPDLP